MLPKAKIALVQVAKRHLGMADADYRALLRDQGGVDSATELDQRGFDDVMIRFGQLGFVSKRTREGMGLGRVGMATTGQIQLIRALWRELVEAPSDRSLDKWLDHSFGVSAVRFLTHKKAHAVIGAMRRWKSRKQGHGD